MVSWLRLALAGVLSILAPQEPPAPAPQFRSRIDLLRVDVSVLDASGAPLRDLDASDFTVTVDGRPRKVLFAQFSGASADASAKAAVTVAHGTNVATLRGRAVVFVLDLESIRGGSEKLVLDTAARLVDSLGPNDAASLVPVPGTSVPLTRERATVADSLRRLRGMTIASTSIRHFFTIDEAVAFEKNDPRVKAEVIERECSKSEERARMLEGTDPRCPTELAAETKQRLLEVRAHTQALLTAITTVAGTLRQVDVPRTMVLISGGLPFEPESLTWFRQVERALGEAGVTLHAVHVDQPDADASSRFRPGTESVASRDQQSGLANVASVSGGAFFAGVGTAAGVFDRLRNEVAYSYDLGVETVPEDATRATPREITVTVSRPNARVRTRRELTMPAPAGSAQERLAQLMSQPFDVSQLPIATAVQTVRGFESTTVKTIVVADLARGVATQAPIRYALAFTQGGTTAFRTEGVATPGTDVWRVMAPAQLTPGRYRLRLAAVDAAGREGALELPVMVGVRAAGDLQLSDLLLGAVGEPFQPALLIRAGESLVSALELYSGDPARFGDAAVTFEVRREAETALLTTVRGELRATDAEQRQLALAELPTATWAPGSYHVSAVISTRGQPVGRVSRGILVAAAEAPVTAEAPTAAPEPILLNTSDPSLEPTMRKVAEYVAVYGEKASAIVATETYTQYLSSAGGAVRRQLVAEFALVKSAGTVGWLGYRDVVEVDGDPVRDRRDRLLKLVTGPSDPSTELRRISDESARFNMGPVIRNFNVPTTVLFFFHPANISRFTFTKKGTRTIDGVPTLEVAFKETARPSMIMTKAGKDVPCEGTLWIRPDDGAVVRTRLRLRGFADALAMGDAKAPAVSVTEYASPSGGTVAQPQTPAGSSAGASSGGSQGAGQSGGSGGQSGGSGGQSGGSSGGGTQPAPTAGASARPAPSFTELNLSRIESRADVEVTYRPDEALGMWLPSKMTEEYEGPIPGIRRAPISGSTRTVAAYSDFKQFGTAARVKEREKLDK